MAASAAPADDRRRPLRRRRRDRRPGPRARGAPARAERGGARARRARGRRERPQLRPRVRRRRSATATTLECALRARERWLELGRSRRARGAARPGRWWSRAHEDELAVLEGVARRPAPRRADAHRRARLAALAPIPTDGLLGALHAHARPARGSARRGRAALARCSQRDSGARVEWGAHVHDGRARASCTRDGSACARRRSSSARGPTSARCRRQLRPRPRRD